jgi:predicted alpha/beta-hydrolase family hydrolase
MEFTAAGVRGFLDGAGGRHGLVLAHGAGSDARAPLLAAVADAFSAAGFAVLRCDLPFRQARPAGPPSPAGAARDRQGLKDALAALRPLVAGRLFLGGHSYGGRQATLLAAEEPEAAAGLLLLSYPLHPPHRPETLRTAHFPALRTPTLFVHGRRDPFGSPAELEAALRLIPAPTRLLLTPGGHDLRPFSPAPVLEAFRTLMDT